MKMSDKLYDALATDIRIVAARFNTPLNSETSMDVLWTFFHKVLRDRSYDDEHPGFSEGYWERILDYQDRFWLDRFYKDEDLNDDHIATALRRIAKNTAAPSQKELTK